MAKARPIPARAPAALLVGPRALGDASRHIAAAPERENVGLLVGRLRPGRRAVGTATRFLPLPNRAADPSRRFEVAASDLARALERTRRLGLVAVAVLHSHPRGPARPSESDRLGAWPELATVVVAGAGGTWRAFGPGAGGVLERLRLVRGRRRVLRAADSAKPVAADIDRRRFARQMVLPEIGAEGQRRLAAARVLLVGLGGLGSPIALYLAAAGVGTLGLCDGDRVEVHNLHRQILFGLDDVGRPKAQAAADRLRALAGDALALWPEPALTRDNATGIVGRYDLVVHGSDAYQVRDILNRVCVGARKPWVDATVYRWTAQVAAYLPDGPCYRCHVPVLPAEGEVENCDVAGVAGPVVGMAGSIEATEALKILLGVGAPLAGRLLLADMLNGDIRTVGLRRRDACPVCGTGQEEAPHAEALPTGEAAALLAAARGLAVGPEALSSWHGAIVDVRAPERYAAGHLPGALSLPWATPEAVLALGDGAVLLVCDRGRSSARLALALTDRLAEVRTLTGGMDQAAHAP